MKKNYIKPVLVVQRMKFERAVLQTSNVYDTQSLQGINFNPETMETGDGDDAARQHVYSVWDD